MKRVIALLLFSQFILLACTNNSKQVVEPELVPVVTSGILKVCRIYSSEFVILDKEDKGRLIQEYRFNKKGYVNELLRYGMDGSIIAQFDIYGQENPFPSPDKAMYTDTVLTVTNLSVDGEVSKKEVKKYNSRGLLVESSLFSIEEDMIQKNTYAYDKNNRIIKDVYWDVDLNVPMQIVRYEYEYYHIVD